MRLHLDTGDAQGRNGGSLTGASARAWSTLTVSGMLILILLASLGETGIRSNLTAARLTELQITLLWVAALVRAGVYPLHFWLTGARNVSQPNWLPVQLIGATAGLWLLGRVHALAGPDFLRRPEWIALSALALLGTALVAWTVQDGTDRWRWIALNRASLAVMAAYTAAAPGPEALVWSLVTFGLGCALLAAGQALIELTGFRLPAILAALALWGMPGTVGFLARSALVFPTEAAQAAPLFAVVLLAEVLFVASLWQAVAHDYRAAGAPQARGRRRCGASRRHRGRPGRPADCLRPAAPRAGRPRRLVARGGRQRNSAMQSGRRGGRFGSGCCWQGFGGITLGVFRERLLSQVRGWQAGIANIASLEWLYAGARGGFQARGRRACTTSPPWAKAKVTSAGWSWPPSSSGSCSAGECSWITTMSLGDLFRQLSLLIGTPAVILAGAAAVLIVVPRDWRIVLFGYALLTVDALAAAFAGCPDRMGACSRRSPAAWSPIMLFLSARQLRGPVQAARAAGQRRGRAWRR